MNRIFRSEKGSVLVLVMATILVMLVIGVGFTAWFMQTGITTAFHKTEKKEYQRTETGIERALLELKNTAAIRDQFRDAAPDSEVTFTLTIDGRIVNVTIEE